MVQLLGHTHREGGRGEKETGRDRELSSAMPQEGQEAKRI